MGPASLALFLVALGPALVTQEAVTYGTWHLSGPYEAPLGAQDVDTFQLPKRFLNACRNRADVPELGGWTALDDVDQEPIDLVARFGGAARKLQAAYLYRTLEAERDTEVTLCLGSDDGLRIWLDGETLLRVPEARSSRVGQNRVRVPLSAGRHHLLALVTQQEGAWVFQLVHDQERVQALAADFEPARQKAVERGVEFLLGLQRADGSFGSFAEDYRNGATALAAYTLLGAGLSGEHRAIRRAMLFLEEPPVRTYSAGCQLLAYAQVNDPAYDDRMRAIVDDVEDWWRDGWSYPDGATDLSNMQYAVLGLWAASKRGLEAPPKVWQNVLRRVRSYQDDEGGFSYRGDGKATGSMTSAGLTVLALTRGALERAGALNSRSERQIDEDLERGIDWMTRHFDVSKNPMPHGSDGGENRWFYYWLYGMERVGGLVGRERFGPRDWHWEGSQALLRLQGAEGGWATAYGETLPNTCFAILFLQRATKTLSGPNAKPTVATWGQDDPTRDVSLRASGDTPLKVWVSSYGTDFLEHYVHVDERNGERSLDIAAVEYVAGDELVHRIEPAGTVAVDDKLAAELAFSSGGAKELSVTLVIWPPGARAAGQGPDRVSSEVVLVMIQETLSEDERRDTLAWRDNALLGADFRVTSSSNLNDTRRAAYAVDGKQSTQWISANEDQQHELTIDIERAIRADRLVISPAVSELWKPRAHARPKTIEVRVNKRSWTLELADDPRRRTLLEFERTERVKTIVLRMLERYPGETEVHAAGFAEVELQLDAKRSKR